MSEHQGMCPCGQQLHGLQKVYCSNKCRLSRITTVQTSFEPQLQEAVIPVQEPVRLPLELARRLGRVFA